MPCTAQKNLPAAPLEYAGRGMAILPLRPHGKIPLTAHGLKDASKDTSLITALVRAHRWEAAINSGKNNSLRGIAKAEDLEHRYVAEIYHLNSPSPRIKEAILDGTRPRTLTLSRLMGDIPLCWQEQASTYGF